MLLRFTHTANARSPYAPDGIGELNGIDCCDIVEHVRNVLYAARNGDCAVLEFILMSTPSPTVTKVSVCAASHFVLPSMVRPTLLTDAGMDTLSIFEHSRNAYVPI